MISLVDLLLFSDVQLFYFGVNWSQPISILKTDLESADDDALAVTLPVFTRPSFDHSRPSKIAINKSIETPQKILEKM